MKRLITTVAVTMLLATGCSADVETRSAEIGCPLPEGAVAIAAAGRANAPMVEASPSLLTAIDHAIATETHLAIIDTDGLPDIVIQDSLRLKAENDAARADERELLRGQIGDALESIRSQAPEADPLDALGLAASTVRAHGATGTVVLADSGLQTTGALDYTTPGMLATEPERLAAQVKAAGELPDLTGITVVLSGIGSTAEPQEQLSNAARERLQQQWVELATAAGAACVYLDEMPNSRPAPTGVPSVSIVEPPPPPVYDLSEPVPLREDVLNFRDNSPELVDRGEAEAQVQALVDALKAADGSIMLTGTTASGGTEQGRRQLSLDRAETAKELFVSMGLEEARITTEGVGTDFPGFENDLDAQGRQIEEIAARNRSVIVTVQSVG